MADEAANARGRTPVDRVNAHVQANGSEAMKWIEREMNNAMKDEEGWKTVGRKWAER
jgi:hypothetical protein